MEFTELLRVVGSEPVFDTGLLLAGNVEPADVRRQLSRWKKAGRIWQLRRGVYALAPPAQKVKPHPFVVANRLVHGSYVSLQSALAHHGLIPEYVPVTMSVTSGRPGRWDTPLGSYEFRHVKVNMFAGYRLTELVPDQEAFVAAPEKALLDLVHLEPGGESEDFLVELRLQNLMSLNLPHLRQLAGAAGTRKLKRAAAVVEALAAVEKEDFSES